MYIKSRADAMDFVRDNMTVVEEIVQAPYVMVRIHCTISSGLREAIGFSKCNPCDKFDSIRGLAIARGRAVHNLALTLIHRPTGGVIAFLQKAAGLS